MNVVTSILTKQSFLSHICRAGLRTTPSMPLKNGDKVPSVDLYESAPTNKFNLNDLSTNKKIVVFGVPGAFTPGCNKTHLPGYIDKADELRKQGIAEIICIAVNDPFVTEAWGRSLKAQGKVRLFADPGGEFTKALDLGMDIAALGGYRSKRYSMTVENGVICNLQVEPDGTGLTCSLVQNLKIN